MKQDIILCKSAASEHASLRHFNHICQSGSWMALWDSALEYGTQGTSQTLALLRAFSQPLFSDCRCPLQDNQTCILPPNITALEHFGSKHNITLSAETIVTSVENRQNSLFSYSKHHSPIIIIIVFLLLYTFSVYVVYVLHSTSSTCL